MYSETVGLRLLRLLQHHVNIVVVDINGDIRHLTGCRVRMNVVGVVKLTPSPEPPPPKHMSLEIKREPSCWPKPDSSFVPYFLEIHMKKIVYCDAPLLLGPRGVCLVLLCQELALERKASSLHTRSVHLMKCPTPNVRKALCSDLLRQSNGSAR